MRIKDCVQRAAATKHGRGPRCKKKTCIATVSFATRTLKRYLICHLSPHIYPGLARRFIYHKGNRQEQEHSEVDGRYKDASSSSSRLIG